MSSSNVRLHEHSRTVRVSRTPITCPTCRSILLPKNFGNHCRDHHDLNPSTQCIWCGGAFRWQARTKHLQADHLVACYDRFLSSNRTLPPIAAATSVVSPPTPALIDLEPLCEPLQFFGHRRLADLPPRAYRSGTTFWTTPYEPVLPTFQCESLNAARGYIRLFLDRRDPSCWYHAMVKACAFASLLRAMDRAGGEITALPFSCWCNGGPHPEARFRHHRHLILVAAHHDETTFKMRFWSNVKAEGVPSPRFPCKRLKKIESALHLVNTIGYLSRRESRCKFSFENKNKKEGSNSRLNHFHIFRALPRDFKLPLVLGWDGGILELLKWEKLNNVKIEELATAAADGTLVLKDGSYRREIRHFFGGDHRLSRGLVLPVNKRFVPIAAAAAAAARDNNNDPFLHLAGGRRLVFEEVPRMRTLDDDEWVRMQAERGNVFYDIVGDAWWTPKSHHQAFLKCLVPVVEENAELKRRLATLQKESEKRIEELEAEIERLKTESKK